MTTIFTKNDDFIQPILSLKSSFAQLVIIMIFSSARDKSRDPTANWNKLEHMYTTKDPLCNISGGWELYLTSHRVRKADKASIHYLQSITK